jgi:hypothetical protein
MSANNLDNNNPGGAYPLLHTIQEITSLVVDEDDVDLWLTIDPAKLAIGSVTRSVLATFTLKDSQPQTKRLGHLIYMYSHKQVTPLLADCLKKIHDKLPDSHRSVFTVILERVKNLNDGFYVTYANAFPKLGKPLVPVNDANEKDSYQQHHE